MIVSYEGVVGGLLLREVDTEEEAFAEMRKYLEVNNILSNYTEVYWEAANEKVGISKHKEVAMLNTQRIGNGGATFGIYYDGSPRYTELSAVKKDIAYQNPSDMQTDYDHWYDQLDAYFRDFK